MSLARPCKRLRVLAPPNRPCNFALPYRPSPTNHVSHRHYTRRRVWVGQKRPNVKRTALQRPSILAEFLNQPQPALPGTFGEKKAGAGAAGTGAREAKPEDEATLTLDGEQIDPKTNPFLAEYLENKRLKAKANKEKPQSKLSEIGPVQGSLAPSSIFEMEETRRNKASSHRKAASGPLHQLGSVDEGSTEEGQTRPLRLSKAERRAARAEQRARTFEPQEEEEGEQEEPEQEVERNEPAMMARLNPKPVSELMWRRKMVIREVRKRGRLTRKQLLLRTERFDLSKSDLWRTSVKKLGMLARQIQGKTVDDAMTQMRYSKKKVAQEVFKHLEFARDKATVRKGMGLGKATDNERKAQGIRLKDGTFYLVTDKTKMYIDQAWVGRGPYGKDIDYRARGRSNVLRLPQTTLSVLLKEEATRIREHEEREEKLKRRKLWVPLPDRPIIGQRQYFCW